MHGSHVADLPARDELSQSGVTRRVPVVERHGDAATRAFDRVGDRPHAVFGRCERLLDDDVGARVESRDHVIGVRHIGRSHDHAVNAEFGDNRRQLIGRKAMGRGGSRGQRGLVIAEPPLVCVGPGDELRDIRMHAGDGVDVHLGARARADDCVTQHYLIPVVANPLMR